MKKATDSVLEIKALSRPLDLGTLYDARKDQLVPGISLWKMEDIKAKTIVSPQPNTRFQVSASEFLSEKNNLLDVSASLKLSFFGGLIEAGGSVKYLKEKTSSTLQCSVTLNFHGTTVSKELMISELGAPDPKVLSSTGATHVVSQVVYGADALMEFQETASDESNKQEIQVNLNMMIKKIPSVEVSAQGSVNISNQDKEKVKGFSCKFYGDFILEELPSTYEEAVKVYKKLPILLGKSGEGVPVMVWLYPLSNLSNTESKLKTMISETLVLAIGKVMDDFHLAEITINDLLEKSKAIKAEDITTKLEKFQNSLRIFTVEFSKKLLELTPAIRGGDMEEGKLRELLKSLDASGFSMNRMMPWLNGKKTEINAVTMYIKKLQYDIKSPGSELDSFLINPDVPDTFVFSFTSLQYEEPYLNDISGTAENFKSGSTIRTLGQDQTQKVPWYRRPEAKVALDSALKIITEETIKNNNVISFVPDAEYLGASVQWYQGISLKDPHVTNQPINLLRKYACKLTLDPNTANTKLILSEGNRKVTRVRQEQSYPDHPDRFDHWPQMLCREGLTGRCYWEVEHSGEDGGRYRVDIAVAYKSIKRKGWASECSLGCNAQSWLLDCKNGTYSVWHKYVETVIPDPSSSRSRRVGVFLDYPAGTLSFYSVSSDTLTHLYTFHSTFTEPLYPGFWFENDGISVSLCQIT